MAWPACEVPPPRAVIGHAVPGGDGDGGGDVVARARQDHAARLDLVDAGVGRIEGARRLVEPHLAGHRRAQLSF